ncbi:hypothetical protein V6N13_123596 [Hibiscus sabdariffa]|uniref:Uncharacterized protein n=1 Tax=Hibiscus sabdariffa TaxID=183260 RepID=A0ABR2QTX3_9ROSI
MNRCPLRRMNRHPLRRMKHEPPAVPQPPAEELVFPEDQDHEELIVFPDNDPDEEEIVHGFWDVADDNLDDPNYPTGSTSSSDSSSSSD